MTRPVLLVALASLGPLALAHDLDLTLIKVNQADGRTSIEVMTPLSRFVQTSQLGSQPSGPELDLAIRERLHLGSVKESQLSVDTQGDMLRWTGTAPHGDSFAPSAFGENSPAARTIVATYRDGKLESERVVEPEAALPPAIGMLGTGVQHILSGLDHILFVVGLALLGGGWKTILKVLTAFTVGHSITLSLASMGLIFGNPKIVEPLIALSIVALAVEGIRGLNSEDSENRWPRIAIAFGFGLVHGLGFAGGLSDLGFRGQQLTQNLFSFSVGIELGQLAILTPSLLLLAGLSKLGNEKANWLTLTASIGLGMVGCFWLMERVF